MGARPLRERVLERAPEYEDAWRLHVRVLEGLGDRELQALAVAKMEGRTNEEIAREMDCSIRTVERQLRLIRKKWETVGAA